jgi:TonB-dependent starch-binding outer membrane protein SusC
MKKLTTIALRNCRCWSHGPLFLLLFILSFSLSSIAQTTRVTGKITGSQGEGLAGVSVVAAGNATSTDADGVFSIEATPGDSLRISYVGYKTVSRLVTSGGAQLSIALEPMENTMGDVVVVGYSSQRKNAITGAVSTVNLTNLSKTRVPEVGLALQGQVPGVFVAANTGAPGDGVKLRIRGEGTLGQNGVL